MDVDIDSYHHIRVVHAQLNLHTYVILYEKCGEREREEEEEVGKNEK